MGPIKRFKGIYIYWLNTVYICQPLPSYTKWNMNTLISNKLQNIILLPPHGSYQNASLQQDFVTTPLLSEKEK